MATMNTPIVKRILVPIMGTHCEQCGSTDAEDVDTHTDEDLQGATACCNQPSVGRCDARRCWH